MLIHVHYTVQGILLHKKTLFPVAYVADATRISYESIKNTLQAVWLHVAFYLYKYKMGKMIKYLGKIR